MVVVMIVPGVHRVEMALRAAAGLILHLNRNVFNLILMLLQRYIKVRIYKLFL